MVTMCLLGVVCAAGFAVAGPWLAGKMPPRTALQLLVGGGVLTTAAVTAILAALGSTVVAQLPAVARAGGWSLTALRDTAPVPGWAAMSCLALLAPAGAVGVAAAARRAWAMVRLHRTCRHLDSPATLVVLDSDRPEAFATPAAGGRVVVTTAMLRGMRADEVQVLLEHERSHLRNRHTWWIMGMQVCAAVNPMLRPVARAAGHAVERWADEDAARAVGDRRLVARTLARAALHVHDAAGTAPGAPRVSGVLGALGGTVLTRVQSLLDEPPRRHLAAVLTLTALLLATLAWTAGVQDRTDDFFDAAHARPAVTQPGPPIP
jgi:hypothetical protein